MMLAVSGRIGQKRHSYSYKAVGSFFVVLCLVPWVSFGLLDVDTQPWFLMAGIAFCLLSVRVKGDPFVVVLAVAIAFSALIVGFSLFRGLDFYFARGVLGYAGFSVVLLGYYFYRKRFGFPLGIFVTLNLVWLAAGGAQVVFGGHLLDLVVAARTTEGRGVVGLATEPTYYGMFLLFLSWILVVEAGYRPTKGLVALLLMNVLFVMLVAKSAMAVMFLLLICVMYAVIAAAKVSVIFGLLALACLVSVGVYFGYNVFPDWRVFSVLHGLASAPLDVVHRDASINERVSHLVFPVHASILNGGIPGGFHSFSIAYGLLIEWYDGFFWWGSPGNRVMSGVGAFVYELGWLSVFFFMAALYCAWCKSSLRLSVFQFSAFLALFASALPVAFPLAPILLVSMLFLNARSRLPLHAGKPTGPDLGQRAEDGCGGAAPRGAVAGREG